MNTFIGYLVKHCDGCGWKSEIPISSDVTMRKLRWMKRRLALRFNWHFLRVHLREAWKDAS